MADRTVRVTLVAQASGYIAGMDQAARKTRELGSEAEKLAQKRAAFETLGRGMLAVGLAAAVAVGFAVSKFAEFDQAMSQVQAVTQETADGQKALWDAALEAGGRFPQTAREAANAEEELAKAGITTANILSGALSSSLELANAGQLEVARSAEIVGITLKQFNLDGTQAARVADVLTASANKAVGGVEELAQGLKFVGPVSDSMNVSLEDTVATLTLFADRGVLGEQAGTSLRGVLSSLTSPSKAAQKELARLNVELYDGQGRFLGLENTAGQLNKALDGVSDSQRDLSLGIIFGNQQVTAARILVDAGAATWREYRAAVDDSGIAARIAAERMDNLAGDVEKLGGALDTALIQTGSGANGALRGLVQSLTGLVDIVGSLPAPVQTTALALLGLTAAVAGTVGAAALAIPRYALVKSSLDQLTISGRAAAAGIGATSAAMAAIAVVLNMVGQAQAKTTSTTQDLKDSLDPLTGAVTSYTRELIAKNLAESGAVEAAARAGVSQKQLTDAVIEGGDALSEVGQKIANLNAGASSGGMLAQASAIAHLNEELATAKSQIDGESSAANGAVAPNSAAAAAYHDAADQAAQLQSNLDQLIDTINTANGVGQDAVTSNSEYQAALANVTKAVEDYSTAHGVSLRNIDESTKSGSANAAMFADLAKKSQEAAQAQFELDHNVGLYQANLQAGHDALYQQILDLTGNADAAQTLTDKIYAIPSQKEFEVIAETSSAQESLDRFIRLNNGRSVRINAQVVNGPGFAYGGPTPPGPKFQVAGWVHAGEFVSTQETLAKPANRAALEYMHAGGDISRWQKAPQYMVAPAAGFNPQIDVVVSSRGGIDLLDYIEVQAVARDRSDQLTTRMGRRRP